MRVKDGLAVGCNVDGKRPVGISEGCIVGDSGDDSNDGTTVEAALVGEELGVLVGAAETGAVVVGNALGFPGFTVGSAVLGALVAGLVLGDLVCLAVVGATVIGAALGFPGVTVGPAVGIPLGVGLGG